MMNAMPKMPKMGSISHACICGCGMPTKSTWASGHDGRATGWAMRIEKGVITIDDVPANERNGAVVMLKRRGTEVTMPVATPRLSKAERKAARAAARQAATEADAAAMAEQATGTEG